MRCSHCGYNLAGSLSSCCPECGNTRSRGITRSRGYTRSRGEFIPFGRRICNGLLWAVLFGASVALAGFFSGFVAPIVHWTSNQGPLLGIFVAGPLGLVTGAAMGAILGFLPVRPSHLIFTLILTSIIYGGAWWLLISFTADPGVGAVRCPSPSSSSSGDAGTPVRSWTRRDHAQRSWTRTSDDFPHVPIDLHE